MESDEAEDEPHQFPAGLGTIQAGAGVLERPDQGRRELALPPQASDHEADPVRVVGFGEPDQRDAGGFGCRMGQLPRRTSCIHGTPKSRARPSPRTAAGPGAARPAPPCSRFQLSPTNSSASRRGRPVDQPGDRGVGGLDWICRASPADGTGRFSPGPTRDGSAASHLGGRVRFMQAGPPPFSRGAIVRRASRIGNYPGGPRFRRTEGVHGAHPRRARRE